MKKVKVYPIFRFAVGFIVSGFFLFFLLRGIGVNDFKNAFSKLSVSIILYLFLLYYLTYFLRALRVSIWLKNVLSLKDCFCVVSIHEMLAQLVPFRLGEVSFVLLIKRIAKIPLGRVVGVYLSVRLLDVFSILFSFVVGLFFVEIFNSLKFNFKLISIILLFLFVSCSIIFLFLRERVFAFFEKQSQNGYLFGVVSKQVCSLLVGFNDLSFKRVGLCIIISFLLWQIHFYILFFIFKNLSVCLSFQKVAVLSGMVAVSSVVPIPSFAGIGVIDGVWVALLVLAGVEKSLAISSIIISHAVVMLFYVILGVVGLFLLRKSLRRNAV